MAELLKVNNASMIFGGLRAVSNLTMQIDEGELIGLIGPNGAGKTTAFNMLTGVYEPSEGEITFNGLAGSGGDEEIEEGLDNQHGFRSGKLRQRGQGHEHAVDEGVHNMACLHDNEDATGKADHHAGC